MSEGDLFAAVERGDTAEVSRLNQSGVDVNQQGRPFRTTPLFLACRAGHEACVRLLLEGGAGIDQATFGGETPLWVACQRGHEACARLLVDHGADINQARGNGASPLWVACLFGHEACARLLLQRGADLSQAVDGETPLHAACQRGQEACARLLLKRGADLNARDQRGRTPMALVGTGNACKFLLVGHGARLDSVVCWNAEQCTAVAVGGNQFIKEARFSDMPSEELRAIMWRSPSLQRICSDRGSVTRKEDGLAVRPAVQPGDRVRLLDTDGDWEVASVMGDSVELHGREGTVPIHHLVFAGPGHLAWQEASAAEADGRSNAMTQLLCRRGYVSTHVRSLVTDFL